MEIRDKLSGKFCSKTTQSRQNKRRWVRLSGYKATHRPVKQKLSRHWAVTELGNIQSNRRNEKKSICNSEDCCKAQMKPLDIFKRT